MNKKSQKEEKAKETLKKEKSMNSTKGSIIISQLEVLIIVQKD